MSGADIGWLGSLKPGDPVVVMGSGYYANITRISTVDRLTPTTIVVSGSKFRKSDGYAQGDGWNRSYLVKPDAPEAVEALAEGRMELDRRAVLALAAKSKDADALAKCRALLSPEVKS